MEKCLARARTHVKCAARRPRCDNVLVAGKTSRRVTDTSKCEWAVKWNFGWYSAPSAATMRLSTRDEREPRVVNGLV